MGTLLVAAVAAGIVGLIVHIIMKKTKRGSQVRGCDGDCGHCGGGCH